MIVESTNVSDTTCECCATVRRFVTAYVSEDDSAKAAVLAYCYPPHKGEPSEIWIDVILGTWGSDDHSDHVTFGCRYGDVAGQVDHACSLTDAAQLSDDPILGRRLTRKQALRHNRLGEFWQIVDLVMTTVPAIGEHRARYHPTPDAPGRGRSHR